MELALIEQTAATPGAQALLARLAKRGVRVGILTRNSRAIALTTLARHGLGAYFAADEVLGRDEALPKPAPDGVQKLAAVWGTELSDVLMVGDYLFDLQTGRAAGAATIHVDPSRVFRWPELADLAVGSLAELADFKVNINSVLGSGVRNPDDALAIGRRAVELGFTCTVGIIHDNKGRLRPLAGREAEVKLVGCSPEYFDINHLAIGRPSAAGISGPICLLERYQLSIALRCRMLRRAGCMRGVRNRWRGRRWCRRRRCCLQAC